MENRKPLLSYLLINIAVSAITTFLVLLIWNRLTALPPTPNSDTVVESVSVSAPSSTLDSATFEGQLRITTIIGAGDLQSEIVLIEHIGDIDVPLSAWQLRDEDGNRFSFPSILLHPGGSLEVLSRQGENSVTRLFWNEESSIWSVGEVATLLDPGGQAQANYTIP